MTSQSLSQSGNLSQQQMLNCLSGDDQGFYFSDPQGQAVLAFRPYHTVVLTKENFHQEMADLEKKVQRGSASSTAASFQVGAVGALHFEASYLSHGLEDLLTVDQPLGFIHYYREVLLIDRLRDEMKFIVTDVEENSSEGELQQSLLDFHQRIEELASRPCRLEGNAEVSFLPRRDRLIKMMLKVKEQLNRGNLFQCVLSEQREADYVGDELFLLRELMKEQSSSFVFALRRGSEAVIGASPERLIRVDQQGGVTTNPIAGTRRRGRNPEEDEKLAQELRDCPKELAEHLMLVDLARNDLSRVCLPGSVQVSRYLQLERYRNLMHLVSQVEGKLQSDQSSLNALLACFPAGTLSGAPKREAIHRIQSLEKRTRGIYGGCLFLQDFRGALDSVIAIRSLHLQKVDEASGNFEGQKTELTQRAIRRSKIQYGAGAGIVLDSVFRNEVKEINHKAKTVEAALYGGRNVLVDR